ncbi:MAG: hypothetical protein ACR2RL_08510 [Gammaproteobacteria bacterium]
MSQVKYDPRSEPTDAAGEPVAPAFEKTRDTERPQGTSNARVHDIASALKSAQAPPAAANDQDDAIAQMTDQNELAALADRVGRLEKYNRWMRGITTVLVLGTLIAAGGWFYSDGVIVNRTIMESEELKLIDSKGNPRLFLRMYSRVPVLQLVDGNGKPRMSLGLRFDDTPFIDLSDKEGRTRATLEMTEEDAPALRLFNEDGGTKFQIN